MHSSAANSAIENIANRLTADGDFDKGISVRLLLKNWSAAFSEWPIKAIRDALYASPQFPRIIDGTAAIQDTIAKAVSACEVAYVGKTSDGRYSPFIYDTGMLSKDVEISDDVFLIRKEAAEAYAAQRAPKPDEQREGEQEKAGDQHALDPTATQPTQPELPESLPGFIWSGEVPAQKWMNFYTRVLAKYSAASGMKLTVKVEINPQGGVSKQKVEETKKALRELGLDQKIELGDADLADD